MSITFGDHLIDIGYYDITPEQEREIEAREECARRGIDPDEICADGGVLAWMVVDQERRWREPPISSSPAVRGRESTAAPAPDAGTGSVLF